MRIRGSVQERRLRAVDLERVRIRARLRADQADLLSCFFFSSRRRHTRYWRDWSSDVCSSDLRAEVTDVANAIYDGTDAIMLSGETAAGKYPVEAVKTMNRIALRTEETLDYTCINDYRKNHDNVTVTDAISHATCTTALDLGASAIITCTSSGYTTRMVSKFRPKAPIIAATADERVMRRMALTWGAYPVLYRWSKSTDEVIEEAIEATQNSGYVNAGDLVVVTAGVPVGKTGKTNLIKVSTITEFIGRGVGIGRGVVEGKVRLVNPGEDVEFDQGDILVTIGTDKHMVKYIEKASAVVTECGGMTSHAAIAGINLGVPVVVSVEGITEKVKTGDIIKVETTIGAKIGRASCRERV